MAVLESILHCFFDLKKSVFDKNKKFELLKPDMSAMNRNVFDHNVKKFFLIINFLIIKLLPICIYCVKYSLRVDKLQVFINEIR